MEVGRSQGCRLASHYFRAVGSSPQKSEEGLLAREYVLQQFELITAIDRARFKQPPSERKSRAFA